MAIFGGHIISGTAFAFFGLRWTYCILQRYFLCQRELILAPSTSRRFRSSLMFPVSWCPNFPLEAAVWLFAVIVLAACELATMTRTNFLDACQHLTIFLFYGAAASVLILKHYRYPMLPEADYVGIILCLVVDVLLIYRHLQMKSALEAQVHQDSMLVMLVGALMLCLEIKFRHNPMLSLIRAICFSLTGSWAIMEDFMLYRTNGKWPNEDHRFLTIAAISFVLHVIGHLLLVGLISCLTQRSVRNLSHAEVFLALDREGLDQGHKIAASSAEQGENLLTNNDDDD